MEIYEEIERVEVGDDSKSVLDYVKEIIACKIQLKSVQNEIKEIKSSAKENGVLVKEIDSVLSEILREMKKSPMDRNTEDSIRIKIEKDEGVMGSLSVLI